MRRAPAIAPSSSSQRTSRQRTCSTAGSWSVCNAPFGEARIACAVWHGGHTAPEDGATLPAAHLNHHSASVSSPIPSSVAGTSPHPGIPSIAHRCTAEGEKRPMWSKARELSTFRRVAPILHGTCCWNRLTMPGSCLYASAIREARGRRPSPLTGPGELSRSDWGRSSAAMRRIATCVPALPHHRYFASKSHCVAFHRPHNAM